MNIPLPILILAYFCPAQLGASEASEVNWSHQKPVPMRSEGKLLSLPSPGFAAPCVADIDGNGTLELIVGQFSGGRMKVYDLGEDQHLNKGKWLAAEGEIAQMPGVG